MFCRNCGNKIPDDARLCNYCGASQDSVHIQNNARSDSAPQSSIKTRQAAKPAGKKSAKGTIFIFMAIFAFVIVYFGIKESDGSAESDVPIAEESVSTSKLFNNTEPQGLDRDEVFYPYYAGLNDLEKITYEEILSGVKAGATEVKLSKGEYLYDTWGVRYLAGKISYDNPELFWFDADVTCNQDQNGNIISVFPKYNNLLDDLESNRNAIEAVVAPLMHATENMTDLEAEKYFYDYLCQNVAYVKGEYDQNIYSAFVLEETVCSGYTHALQYLMMRRDVPCYYATGFAYDYHEEEVVRHSWNVVKLNESFYNCDVTFGDFYNEEDQHPSYISYNIFNIPDDQILDNQHQRDHYGVFLPECNSEELSYYALYGTDWEYSLVEQLNTDGTYVITSVDEYFNFLYNWLITNGSGIHDFTFIIKKDVYDQIPEYSNNDYGERVIEPAVDYLGLHNWSNANWSDYGWGLDGEEYVYVEMHLELY